MFVLQRADTDPRVFVLQRADSDLTFDEAAPLSFSPVRTRHKRQFWDLAGPDDEDDYEYPDDYNGDYNGDYDYNDFAVLLTLAPTPQAALLGILGLGGVGLATGRRRSQIA